MDSTKYEKFGNVKNYLASAFALLCTLPKTLSEDEYKTNQAN